MCGRSLLSVIILIISLRCAWAQGVVPFQTTINAAYGHGATPGMRCDGSTNDGPSLIAFVALAQSTSQLVDLPAGTCIIDASAAGVLIASPVTIRGQGVWNTILSLKTGSTHPMFTVSVTTSTFAPGNGEPAQIELRDLQITSGNRSDAPGQGVAHGLMLINQSGHYHATRVYLSNVMFGGVPGDAIHCGDTQGGGIGGFDGWVEAHGVIAQYAGGYEYFVDGCTDGRWFGGEIAGAIQDGLLLSGASSMIFDGVNFYSNGGYDINVYHSDKTVISNSTIDLTSYANVFANLLAGQRLDVATSTLRWASSQSNAFYGDIDVSSQNAGNIYLTADRFPTPASSPSANKPLSNVNFISGNTGLVYVDGNTNFDLGPLGTSGITNVAASLQAFGVPSVNCAAGSPSGSFTVVNGIVTHC